MRKRIIKLTVATLSALLICLCGTSFAAGSSAVLGTEDCFVGALPPPGIHYINYDLYYYADTLKGSDGDEAGPPDFEATILANVFRPIYVSDITILGANAAWHVVIPLVYQQLKSAVFNDIDRGIGDIYFSPLILGWHSPVYHFVAGLDVIAPTADYDKGAVANIGNNHWTFEPALAFSAIYQNGFSANIKLMYDIHTKNSDYIDPVTGIEDDYKTGQQIHADYDFDYAIMPNWRLGVAGYVLKGLTEDKFGGEKLDDSEEQVFAIGPAIMFSPKKNLTLAAKYLFETEVENRPEGAGAWLKVIYSF